MGRPAPPAAGCNARLFNEHHASSRPLQIFHGTADDQTIIEPCRDYVGRMQQAGHDAALIEYPDAHHGFDGRAPLRFEPAVISGRNCVYVEPVPGSFEVTHRDTGQPAQPAASCLSRGIIQAYHPRAHQRAIQDVKDFLRVTFTKRP